MYAEENTKLTQFMLILFSRVMKEEILKKSVKIFRRQNVLEIDT